MYSLFRKISKSSELHTLSTYLLFNATYDVFGLQKIQFTFAVILLNFLQVTFIYNKEASLNK